MKRTITRVALAAGALLLAVAAPAAGIRSTTAAPAAPLVGDDVTPSFVPAAPDVSPKLESALARLVQVENRSGSTAALDAARSRLVQTDNARIRVEIERTGRADLRGPIAGLGGQVEGTWRNLVQALVPPQSLERVAALPGVRYVRRPLGVDRDEVIGEEVAASNTTASQQAGWYGAGTKVAIIDGGFAGYQLRQAAGDLPTTVKTADFCGGAFTQATEHGTAVAEIVHEMAPSAQLILICYAGDVSFQQAEAYAKSQGANVISHSGSFFNAGRGDGTGPLGSIVADARANNILWVNSAGNSAQRHWAGTWSDPNANGYHNFGPTDEGLTLTSFVDRGDDFCAFLKWDEWPFATDDFDLLMAISSTGQVVAASQTRQTGAQPPTEAFCYTNTTGVAQAFALFIQGIRVASAPRMDIFVRNVDPAFEYQTVDSSVGDPGASASAFTIGAVCWKDNSLEPYSGRGPTIDGRTKPDLAGQDSQSSATYGGFTACGQSGFTGTSASTPTVAGAAAIVKQQNPTFGANEIQAFLETNGLDLGTPGKDNAYGSGALRIPTPSTTGPGRGDRTPPKSKALASKGVLGKTVKLYSQDSDETGEVRLIESVRRGTAVLKTLLTTYAKVKAGATYYVNWAAPRVVAPGALRHCVQAVDRAGNKSPLSCAALTLTKK